MNPFFSIIIPVYKAERFIDQCIESILSQSYTNYELFLVDDGSPDSCPAVCDSWAEKDSRIKVFHQVNKGVSAARNLGINYATGDYIIFLDSDDFYSDVDALKKIHCKLKQVEVDVLIIGYQKYTDGKVVEEKTTNLISDDIIYEHHDIIQLMNCNRFLSFSWDKIVKKSVINTHHIRFPEGHVGEDTDWCIQLLNNNPLIALLNEDFYCYRQDNSNSITKTVGVKNIIDIAEVITRNATEAHDTKNELVLEFLAEQYVLWLTTCARVNILKVKQTIKKMHQYWWLINYDAYPYVKQVKRFRVFGYYPMILILGLYRKLKLIRYRLQ